MEAINILAINNPPFSACTISLNTNPTTNQSIFLLCAIHNVPTRFKNIIIGNTLLATRRRDSNLYSDICSLLPQFMLRNTLEQDIKQEKRDVHSRLHAPSGAIRRHSCPE